MHPMALVGFVIIVWENDATLLHLKQGIGMRLFVGSWETSCLSLLFILRI